MGSGTTILLTTQYLDEADELADQIVIIDHGLAIAAGTSEELNDRVGGDVIEFTVPDRKGVNCRHPPCTVGHLGDLQVGFRDHAGVGDDGHLGEVWAAMTVLIAGIIVVVSARFPRTPTPTAGTVRHRCAIRS